MVTFTNVMSIGVHPKWLDVTEISFKIYACVLNFDELLWHLKGCKFTLIYLFSFYGATIVCYFWWTRTTWLCLYKKLIKLDYDLSILCVSFQVVLYND